jgi:hypothetical protein
MKTDRRPATDAHIGWPIRPSSAHRRTGTVPHPNQNFKYPLQTQSASTSYLGVCGASDRSPKRLGPLRRLARPNSSRITQENQKRNHQTPAAQLAKKPRGADARTFHQCSPANHQFGNHIRTRWGGWFFNVRKPALRLEFELAPRGSAQPFPKRDKL